MIPVNKFIGYAVGVFLSINFGLFWALPILIQGQLYKQCTRPFLEFLFKSLDEWPVLRKIGEEYVYTNPRHADYFFTSLIVVLNAVLAVGLMFYWQLSRGRLEWWMIFSYYFLWIGFGGRMMGGAYTFAHKEGHNHGLYKPWIRKLMGNIFENVIGPFYGNIPYLFTTSHVFVHHKLDGGIGDSFYLWDLDRTSLSQFMLYLWRVLLHTTGYSSIRFFACNNQQSKADLLTRGVLYYLGTAVAILAVTRSFSFLVWFYVQPLIAMTYFLALVNYGFHGFIDFDDKGKSIPCVNATCIVDGTDDSFGEDDHMTHHYNSNVYYKDLPAFQHTKIEDWKKHKASVFQGLPIIELGIYILFGLYDKLADHYVDYTGKMSKQEVMAMLKERAQRIETTYDKYEAFLANPSLEARKSYVFLDQTPIASAHASAGAAIVSN